MSIVNEKADYRFRFFPNRSTTSQSKYAISISSNLKQNILNDLMLIKFIFCIFVAALKIVFPADSGVTLSNPTNC